jgi:hypothetical protein
MTFNLAVRPLLLSAAGMLAVLDIHKTPVLILGMLTYHILGGLHQGNFYSIQK